MVGHAGHASHVSQSFCLTGDQLGNAGENVLIAHVGLGKRDPRVGGVVIIL